VVAQNHSKVIVPEALRVPQQVFFVTTSVSCFPVEKTGK
jgi:hypothetical protein